MLRRLSLQNFKACSNLEIDLANLTLLSGLNSSGKSSVLQSLGLLRQSYSRPQPRGLILNGEWVALGRGRDVLTEEAEQDEIAIAIDDDDRTYIWICSVDLESDELGFVNMPDGTPDFLKQAGFQFLQADRITPALMYPVAPQHIRSASELGAHGQFTADLLVRNRDVLVREGRRKGGVTPKLVDEVAAWLQVLSPGVQVDAAFLTGTDSVRLRFRYSGKTRDVASGEYRATNVGFGLTYVLPIIVACLVTPPNSLLLLENPEAHLHPRGQVALGTLLCRCAADGVQIIVETHSDHLLNGVRLAVKDGNLEPHAIALHFFSRDATGVTKESPKISSTGRLSHWPSGFFDEWDTSLDALLD